MTGPNTSITKGTFGTIRFSAFLVQTYVIFIVSALIIIATFCFAVFYLARIGELEVASQLWLIVLACAWVAVSFVIALCLSGKTFPVDQLELTQRIKKLVHCTNIICYTLCVACVPAMLAVVLFFGVGAFVEGNRVVSQEVGSGLSRGPGYALLGVIFILGGIVIAITNVRHLPRLISFVVYQQASNLTVQGADAPIELRSLLDAAWKEDWAALASLYKASAPEGKAFLRSIIIVKCFAYRVPQEEIDRRLNRMTS